MKQVVKGEVKGHSTFWFILKFDFIKTRKVLEKSSFAELPDSSFHFPMAIRPRCAR